MQRHGGGDRIGGEEQLGRAGHADGARQDPGAAVAGHQSDLEKRRTEHRVAGRDADVRQTGDVVAQPDGGPVHGRDQRDLDPPQRAHHLVDAAPIALADVFLRTGKGAAFLAHRLDVAASRERRASAGQDGATQIGIGIDLGAGFGEQLAVALLAQ